MSIKESHSIEKQIIALKEKIGFDVVREPDVPRLFVCVYDRVEMIAYNDLDNYDEVPGPWGLIPRVQCVVFGPTVVTEKLGPVVELADTMVLGTIPLGGTGSNPVRATEDRDS